METAEVTAGGRLMDQFAPELAGSSVRGAHLLEQWDAYYAEKRKFISKRRALGWKLFLAREGFVRAAKKKGADVEAAAVEYQSRLNEYLTHIGNNGVTIGSDRGFEAAELARQRELGTFGKLQRSQHKVLTVTGAAVAGKLAWDLAGPVKLLIGIPAGVALNKVLHSRIGRGISRFAHSRTKAEEGTQAGNDGLREGLDFKAVVGTDFLEKNEKGRYVAKRELTGKFATISSRIKWEKRARLVSSIGFGFGVAGATHNSVAGHVIETLGIGDMLARFGLTHWFINGSTLSEEFAHSAFASGAAPHGGGGRGGFGGNHGGGNGGHGGNWGGGNRGGLTGGQGGGRGWSGGNGGGYNGGHGGSWTGGERGGGLPDRGTIIDPQHIRRGWPSQGGGDRGGWNGDRGSRGGWNGDRGGQGGRNWFGDNRGDMRGGGGRGGWNGDRGNNGGQGNRGWGNNWNNGGNNRGGGSTWGNNGGQSNGGSHGTFGVNDANVREHFTTRSGKDVWCPPEVREPRMHGGRYYGHAENFRIEWRGHMTDYSGPVQYNEQYDQWQPVRYYPDVPPPVDSSVPPPEQMPPQLEYQKWEVIIRENCNNILIVKEGGAPVSLYDHYIRLGGAPLAHHTADIFKPENIQKFADAFAKSEHLSPADKQNFINWMTEQGEYYRADPAHFFNDKPIQVGEKFDAMLGKHAPGTKGAGELEILGQGTDRGVVMDANDSSPTHRGAFMVPVEHNQSGASVSPASVEHSNASIADTARQLDRIPYTGSDGARHFATGHDAVILFKSLNNGEMTFGEVMRNGGYPSNYPEVRAIVDQVRRMAPSFNPDERVVTALQRLGFDN